ncbi:MAG: hypothetical protein P8X89_14900 [Reinekea sp.]
MACTLRRYGVTDSGIYHQPSIFSEIFERAGTDCTPASQRIALPAPLTSIVCGADGQNGQN